MNSQRGDMPENQSRHPLHDALLRDQSTEQAPDPTEKEKPKGRSIPIPLGAERPILSYILIALNIGIFMVRFFAPDLSNEILFWGYSNSEAILENQEFYRLFTAMFLHLDITHILFNSIALYYIGSNLERLFGHVRFGLVYILGGLVGSILPTFFGSNGLGASGAVFAIWGAEVVFLYHHRVMFGKAGRARLQNSLVLMGINFFIGFSANAVGNFVEGGVRIGNAAHFGGLLGGAVLGWLIAPRFALQQTVNADTGEIRQEIVQTNDLKDKVPALLFFSLGLVALLLIAIVLRP